MQITVELVGLYPSLINHQRVQRPSPISESFILIRTMGGLCHVRATVCRSAPMAASLVSSGPPRCEAACHCYGTSPLEGVDGLYRLVKEHTNGNFIVLPHWNTILSEP